MPINVSTVSEASCPDNAGLSRDGGTSNQPNPVWWSPFAVSLSLGSSNAAQTVPLRVKVTRSSEVHLNQVVGPVRMIFPHASNRSQLEPERESTEQLRLRSIRRQI